MIDRIFAGLSLFLFTRRQQTLFSSGNSSPQPYESMQFSKLPVAAGVATALFASAVAIATPDVVNISGSTVPGIEDTPVPLNLQLDPAFFTGGKQLDVVGTEVGFRDASTPSTATFTVPAGATYVRIRGAGGNNGTDTNTDDEEWLLTDIIAVSYTHLTLPTTPYV